MSACASSADPREVDSSHRAPQPNLDDALRDAGFIGTWEWDLVNSVVFLDRRMADLLIGDAELAGLPISSLESSANIHPDDLIWMTSSVVDAVSRRGRVEVEYRTIQARGGVERVRSLGQVISGPAGPVSVRGIALDVTPERNSSNAEQDQLAKCADHLLAALPLTDDDVLQRTIRMALLQIGRRLARGLKEARRLTRS